MAILFSNNNRAKIASYDTKDRILTWYDNNSIVTIDSATAKDVSLNNILPPGFSCVIVQKGAGNITIKAGAGITIISGEVTTAAAGDVVIIYSTNPNEFAVKIVGSGGGGSMPVPTAWEELPAGANTITADGYVHAIVIRQKTAGVGVAYQIGTSLGNNDIFESEIIPGNNENISVQQYLEGDIHFTTEFTAEVKIFKSI
jgi:hypothetical protein